jgi:hypothetical protein
MDQLVEGLRRASIGGDDGGAPASLPPAPPPASPQPMCPPFGTTVEAQAQSVFEFSASWKARRAQAPAPFKRGDWVRVIGARFPDDRVPCLARLYTLANLHPVLKAIRHDHIEGRPEAEHLMPVSVVDIEKVLPLMKALPFDDKVRVLVGVARSKGCAIGSVKGVCDVGHLKDAVADALATRGGGKRMRSDGFMEVIVRAVLVLVVMLRLSASSPGARPSAT